MNPLPWQADMLAALAEGKSVAVAAPLGAGKTTLLAMAAAQATNRRIVLLAATVGQETIVRKVAGSLGVKGAHRWLELSGSPERLQGYAGRQDDLMLIESAHRLSDEHWLAMIDPWPQTAIVGLPQLEGGFRRFWRSAPPSFVRCTPGWQPELVSNDFHDAMRRRHGVDSNFFRANVLGEWPR